jgi:hypothetical protein
MELTVKILEWMESSILKWCGHLLRLENNSGPKRIFTWSLEWRKIRGSPNMKGEKRSKKSDKAEGSNT